MARRVTQSTRIAVVGAGPAGIMAALEASDLGAQAVLYDTNSQPGRKLLVTGNGRCNISHAGACAGDYVSDAPDALAHILERFGHRELVARLKRLGVLTYTTSDGWCYPLSDSAATVVDALWAALRISGVSLRLDTQVRDLVPRGSAWAIITGPSSTPEYYDRVIVATGGKAHPALGSTGRFFSCLESLGHRILPVHPALVSIEADMRKLQRLQGVRMDARLTLLADGRVLGQSTGNLLFTRSGLSGPAAMNVSYLVHQESGAALTAEIDLLALHDGALARLLRDKRQSPWPLATLLGAVLPAKMPPELLRWSGLPPSCLLNELNQAQLDRVLASARALTLRVTGTRDLTFAQLSTGGVPLAEVDSPRMESRVAPGLHLAGEVLNVTGPCGGYNLLFAQASGVLAGRGACAAT
ncbi:MAG: aminoacetone oxidase family FAD-binding enzyme [Chloroflexi bacterium]|nr:aminoacetone oxidase family FAD-binding enzyme [Chloroflexota bacterium]